MNNNYIIYKELPFYKLLEDEYINTYYTGMYLVDNTNKYIFKSDEEIYYYISLTKENIELLHKINSMHIKEKYLSINEITKFFSKYQDKLKLDKEFINKENKRKVKQRTRKNRLEKEKIYEN